MTNDEKIDGMDAIIEDLIEWELSEYDYEGLKEYFFNTKKEQYNDNPEDLEDMLKYREQYKNTEVVLENTPKITNDAEQWAEYFKGFK